IYVTNQDFSRVFKLCLERADPDFRDVCYQGVGGDAAITASKYVIGEAAQSAMLRELCLQGLDDEAQSSCVLGAVETIIRDLSGDDAQARALCRALGETDLATVCQTAREEVSKKHTSAEHAHHHH